MEALWAIMMLETLPWANTSSSTVFLLLCLVFLCSILHATAFTKYHHDYLNFSSSVKRFCGSLLRPR